MNCNEVKQKLVNYLDNGVSLEDREAIDNHLAVCPSCMEEKEALADIQKEFHQAFEETAAGFSPPPNAWVVIEQRLKRERNRRIPVLDLIASTVADWIKRFGARPVWQKAAAVTAVITLILSLSLTIPLSLRQSSPEPIMVRNPLVSLDGWGWQNPLPQGDWLNDIWGSGPDDIFAVGLGGSIIHYDGSEWNEMASGTAVELTAVWGTGPDNVFVVQGWLHGGWTSTDVDVETVILHYDGSTWSQMESGTSDRLLSIWGSGPDDVYAVGCDIDYKGGGNITRESVIQHYDGSTWSRVYTGTNGIIHSIWGSSASDIYAVGSAEYVMAHTWEGERGYVILHYDGSTWSEMDGGSDETLMSVWGNGPDDVYAVGGKGTILHYNGSAWSPVESGTTDYLSSIWGSSPDDVYAVGSGSSILHYNGSTWSVMERDITGWLTGIWGSSPDDVYAVGSFGGIMHYDSNSWSWMFTRHTKDFLDVWGSSPTDVFAVGSSKTHTEEPDESIFHYDGSEWSPMNNPAKVLLAIWGSSSSDVFAVGYTDDEGVIIHYDGSTWSVMDIGDLLIGPNSNSGTYLKAIWGSSPDDVYAVGSYTEWKTGDENTLVITKLENAICHYDGSEWSKMDINPNQYALYDIWGSSPTDVFAIGIVADNIIGSSNWSLSEGVILHYDGDSWIPMDTSGCDIVGIFELGRTTIWGTSSSDVFAVGGNIIHYDGDSWSPMVTRSSAIGRAIPWGGAICGTSSSDVFVVGHQSSFQQNNSILHYNGSSWSTMDSNAMRDFTGVWCSSTSNDVFVVGRGGTILHYPEESLMPLQ